MEDLGDHGGPGEPARNAAAKLALEIISKITPEEKRQIESDGGIDKNELNTLLSKSNIKPSAKLTEIFNELDTNKNGKLEESEIRSPTGSGRRLDILSPITKITNCDHCRYKWWGWFCILECMLSAIPSLFT